MIDVFRRVNRDAFLRAQLGDRGVERVFLRIIGVGEHRCDVITAVEQGLNAGAANIVVGEDNSFALMREPDRTKWKKTDRQQ